MSLSSFLELVQLMRARHEVNASSHAFLWGGQVLLTPGYSTSSDMIKDFFGSYAPDRFSDFLDQQTHNEQALFLKKYLWRRALRPSCRHRAALLAAGPFDIMLTANMDWPLETDLPDADLCCGGYFRMINGKDWEEESARGIKQRKPLAKILNSHGDLHLAILPLIRFTTFRFSVQVGSILGYLGTK